MDKKMDKYWKAVILVALLAAVALTAVAYGQSESCHIRLPPGDGTVRDNWVEGCDSANQIGSYARFYTFTQGGETRVTITLESETVDTYLNLLEGSSQGRTISFSTCWTQSNLPSMCPTPTAQTL